MAAETVAQLHGTAAEREAAYARLLQLEAEHFNGFLQFEPGQFSIDLITKI